MAVATSTAILIGLAVAAAGTTAYTVHEGNMASKSAATAQGRQNVAEAKQLELQAQAEKTQASADELERQRNLERIMAAQNAVFGSSGADPFSGSFANIQTSDAKRAAEATRLNQVFTDTRQVGFANNIRNLENQTILTRNAAKIYRRTNTAQGIGSIINIGTTAYGAGAKGK